MSALADAGMALPANFAWVATIGVATLADAGMTFPEVTIGVADRTEVVDVLKCGSGGVGWDDRMLPGNGRHAWTPSQQDVYRQYANYVGYVSMEDIQYITSLYYQSY